MARNPCIMAGDLASMLSSVGAPASLEVSISTYPGDPALDLSSRLHGGGRAADRTTVSFVRDHAMSRRPAAPMPTATTLRITGQVRPSQHAPTEIALDHEVTLVPITVPQRTGSSGPATLRSTTPPSAGSPTAGQAAATAGSGATSSPATSRSSSLPPPAAPLCSASCSRRYGPARSPTPAPPDDTFDQILVMDASAISSRSPCAS
jgi:hypothetical protein